MVRQASACAYPGVDKSGRWQREGCRCPCPPEPWWTKRRTTRLRPSLARVFRPGLRPRASGSADVYPTGARHAHSRAYGRIERVDELITDGLLEQEPSVRHIERDKPRYLRCMANV